MEGVAMGNVSKFDKMLAAAERDAGNLAPWKVAFIQQVDKQGQSLPVSQQHPKETPKPKKSK
jgi:hypothetical protein